MSVLTPIPDQLHVGIATDLVFNLAKSVVEVLIAGEILSTCERCVIGIAGLSS